MPQTRFVLKKALNLRKKVLVVINKIDRPNARPYEVVDEVLDLFIDLGADEDQLEFPVVYASAKDGYSSLDPDVREGDMQPLFDAILENIPAPEGDPDGPLQCLFSSLDYDDYIGRIGVGRVERGRIKRNEQAVLCKTDGSKQTVKVSRLYQFEGLKRVECEEAQAGDIICVSGIEGINIGETLCDPDNIDPLPFIKIDEPTISMNFIVNDSPFAGKEGKFVTSRNIRDRLFKEVETNVSMRVEETETTDTFKVSGRGELHLSILIENMRREGYELAVSKPEVIMRRGPQGETLEPMEQVIISVPEEFSGSVISALNLRKGMMREMDSQNGYVRLDYLVPTRGLLGYRYQFINETRGEGTMVRRFECFEPFKGDIPQRTNGVAIAQEEGVCSGYALNNIQERVQMFVEPGTRVYEGMIVGMNSRSDDMVVNPCKEKKATNMRAAGSDDAIKLTPARHFTLEEALEFINDDELVEVVPDDIRLRKKILGELERKRSGRVYEK